MYTAFVAYTVTVGDNNWLLSKAVPMSLVYKWFDLLCSAREIYSLGLHNSIKNEDNKNLQTFAFMQTYRAVFDPSLGTLLYIIPLPSSIAAYPSAWGCSLAQDTELGLSFVLWITQCLPDPLKHTSSFAIKKAGLTLPTNLKSETSDTNIWPK